MAADDRRFGRFGGLRALPARPRRLPCAPWPPTPSPSPAGRRPWTSSTSRACKAAAKRAFENDPAGLTGYGTAIGYPPLRQWIADQHQVDPPQVIVTNGSMQADAFLFDQLVAAGDPVVVERPTYDRTLLGLRQRGADIRPIELEPDGIDVEGVGRADLATASARSSPTSSRTSRTRPATRCRATSATGCWRSPASTRLTIFEDDPYVAIRFSGDPLPTMLSLDSDDTVVYASSFSKTVCPGIRVGYLVGPADVIAGIQKRATNTYISPNMVAQGIVYEFASSGGMPTAIETVRNALRDRVAALTAALERDLPDAHFVAPEGGYFMWVELPEGVDVDALLRRRGRARRHVRQGHRLPARRRAQHAAAGLLGRDAQADRRGHLAPRRGVQLAERHAGGGVGRFCRTARPLRRARSAPYAVREITSCSAARPSRRRRRVGDTDTVSAIVPSTVIVRLAGADDDVAVLGARDGALEAGLEPGRLR